MNLYLISIELLVTWTFFKPVYLLKADILWTEIQIFFPVIWKRWFLKRCSRCIACKETIKIWQAAYKHQSRAGQQLSFIWTKHNTLNTENKYFNLVLNVYFCGNKKLFLLFLFFIRKSHSRSNFICKWKTFNLLEAKRFPF